MKKMTENECQFCHDNIKDTVTHENNSVVAIKDKYPVSLYHFLIIPKRHCENFFLLNEEELLDAFNLIKEIKKEIKKQDPKVTGFNVGMNNGESAGQTVFHCHIHLIPRRDGDTENPRGGVRGVIPGKMNY